MEKEKDSKEKGGVFIPRLILRDGELKASEKIIAGVYWSFSRSGGSCYLTKEGMAEYTSMSVDTVKRARKRLQKLGYITVSGIRTKWGSASCTPKEMEEKASCPSEGGAGCVQDAPEKGGRLPPQKEKEKKIKEKKERYLIEEAFRRWYAQVKGRGGFGSQDERTFAEFKERAVQANVLPSEIIQWERMVERLRPEEGEPEENPLPF